MAVRLEVTTENLLNAVAQMPDGEFERFVERAKQLRNRRKERKFSPAEVDLIHKINTIYSAEKRRRYNELYDKFQQEQTTAREHRELLKLNDEFETLNAQRLELLGELAKLRGKSLRAVLKDLGMKS